MVDPNVANIRKLVIGRSMLKLRYVRIVYNSFGGLKYQRIQSYDIKLN